MQDIENRDTDPIQYSHSPVEQDRHAIMEKGIVDVRDSIRCISRTPEKPSSLFGQLYINVLEALYMDDMSELFESLANINDILVENEPEKKNFRKKEDELSREMVKLLKAIESGNGIAIFKLGDDYSRLFIEIKDGKMYVKLSEISDKKLTEKWQKIVTGHPMTQHGYYYEEERTMTN